MDNLNQNNNTINTKLEQALFYCEELGWSIIPVNRDKTPLIEWKKHQNQKADSNEIRAWFKAFPEVNIAVVTGKISNLVVVDIDPRHGGDKKYFKDIKTIFAKTGGGGWHYYFQYKEGVKNQVQIRAGVDIRGEGGYVVLPPSNHKSGNAYEWILSPRSTTPLAPIPTFIEIWQLPEETTNNPISKWSPEILKGVTEGSRNESAASLIGKLLKRYPIEEWESEAWRLALGWNQLNNPPLSETELRSVFNSIKKTELAGRKEGKQPSLVIQLVESIKNIDVILFHDQYKEGYVAVYGDGKKVIKIRSRQFRQWIAYYAWRQFQKIPSSETILSLTQTLEGQALFEGNEYYLSVRIAYYNNAVWYDICDGRVVKINKSGWNIIENPPILFRRFTHQSQQAIPQQGDNIKDLCNFINLKSKREQLLFLVYTIASFIPNFSHPLLVLYGPQGSGKTTPLKLLKSLVDPSILQIMSAPDSDREFIQLASHHYFFFLDNISSLSGWLSDSLARTSTGEGFSKRELYSDDDDIIYSFQRTIGLNGINLVVEKADLLDRSILLMLDRIPKQLRREEKDFWESFEVIKPRLLGSIFTAVSLAMREYSLIQLSSRPRMADFTRWGCAIAKVLGYKEEDFLNAYSHNINSQNEAALEASPVGTAMISFIEEGGDWEGTPSELLEILESVVEKLKINIKSNKKWPKDPSWLTKRIQQIHSNLADQGIMVTKDETARPRKIRIQKVRENADVPDMASKIPEIKSNTNPTPNTQVSQISDEHGVRENIASEKPSSAPTPPTASSLKTIMKIMFQIERRLKL